MGGPPMGGMPPGMGGPMMGGPVMASSGGTSKVKIIAGAIGAVVIIIGLIIGGIWASGKSTLRIVNVASSSPITVTVDGEVVAKNVQFSPTEDASKVQNITVGSGKHKIEAKDATGKVLDPISVELKGFFGSHLYAPGRNATVCFFVQTDEFKTNPNMADKVKDRFKPLDPTKNFWLIEDSIEYWFRDTPDEVTIKTKKGEKNKSVVKKALRQGLCNDPNFQD